MEGSSLQLFDLTTEQQATLFRIINADYLSSGIFATWNRERLLNFNAVAGEIFSGKDLKYLKEARRPAYQYNLYMPLLLRLTGGFVGNMPGADFRPQGMEDEKAVDIFRNLNDWILKLNDIDKQLAKAYLDALIGRIGWIRQDYFYNAKFPDGNVRIRRVDPFNLKFDTDFKERNLSDCNWVEDSRFLSPEEIVAIYAPKNQDLAEKTIEASAVILGTSTDSKQVVRTWAERVFNNITNYSGEGNANEAEDSALSLTKNYLQYKNGMLRVIDWYERRSIQNMTITDLSTGQ